MKKQTFITQNLRRYKRYYLLIALAVALANTIITGSLFVGDSVRYTLVSRVDERLGNALTLITSGTGFMDEALADMPALKGSAATVFFTNGFVSHSLALQPVSVWGVDSSIESIAAQGFVVPDVGEVVINRKTANELSLNAGDDIVVRLPSASMIPSGSLFVTDNYTTSLRLRIKAIVDSRQSGNLNLRNEQSLPFNLFINRQELLYEMDMEGKCNIIMLNRNLSDDELSKSWLPSLSGITVENRGSYQEVVSEAVFLDKNLVSRLNERFPNTNHLFSYLVNDISATSKLETSIPYSFVTAIDRFGGIELTGNDMILSDYAALRLSASIGDTVTLAFYVSAELKVLSEEKRPFVVRDIMPLQVFHADGRLSAEFPGLYDVDNCADWDSDLPIEMERITQEDEDYWDLWRTTPKALIAYSEAASLWSNNYGVATALRISSDEEVALSEILSSADAGITLVLPRETGLAAARGGVDFKSLFLSLAFFVIAAALLLATIPLGGMMHDRRKELLLLQALGYTTKRIHKILVNELAIMTVVATVTGMITAVIYNILVLFALGNIWKGAVHTENFIASIEPASLIIGSIISLSICFATVWLSLRRILKINAVQNSKFKIKFVEGSALRNSKLKIWLPVFLLVLMHILIFANFAFAQSPVLYMATGLIALLASITGYTNIVSRWASKPFNKKSIVYKNLKYRIRNGLVSVAALTCGVFVVFSVGLNRKSFSDSSSLMSGTGGFTLWGENSVPLYHSLSTTEGRTRFGLSGLPEKTEIIQLYRNSGDDASCLNLNKAPQPTVIGVDVERLAKASFTFAETKIDVWSELKQKQGEFYPVIADQTVLQWGLMKSVGDTITYINRKGEPVILQFIGGLDNSIFQGNLLIDKEFFAEIWGEDGSELMLVKTTESSKHDVKQMLSHALANYGLQLEFCNERLKEFNSVIDSYLTIFLMLGGLGLLIGLFGMLLIIKRGLLDRAGEVSTLLAIGFKIDTIKKQLFRESMTVPVYAIAAGTIAALLAVTSAIPAVSMFTWITMLIIIVLLISIALLYAKISFKIENKQ